VSIFAVVVVVILAGIGVYLGLGWGTRTYDAHQALSDATEIAVGFSRETTALAAFDNQSPAEFDTQAEIPVGSREVKDINKTRVEVAHVAPGWWEFSIDKQKVCLLLGTSVNDDGTVTRGSCDQAQPGD
jgi:hypothetical protein